MDVIAVNGSPRKNGNTATMLMSALEGASAQGARTDLVHLYDLGYKGCVSCFACKQLGSPDYGHCAVYDGLTQLLERIAQADALVIGSPVYLGQESGEIRMFLERLLFPYIAYDEQYSSLFGRKMRTALIYTMNVKAEQMELMSYAQTFERTGSYLERVFGSCEILYAHDTCQFDDYSLYQSSAFDAEEKYRRKEEVFPEDCQCALELGTRLTLPF